MSSGAGGRARAGFDVGEDAAQDGFGEQLPHAGAQMPGHIATGEPQQQREGAALLGLTEQTAVSRVEVIAQYRIEFRIGLPQSRDERRGEPGEPPAVETNERGGRVTHR